MKDKNSNFLKILIAKSHLKLSHRESKVFDFYFLIHGNFLINNKRAKITLQQTSRILHISNKQLHQALQGLVLRNIILSIPAKNAEIIKDKKKLHSIVILEQSIGNPVYGVLFDKQGDTFFCFNYNWNIWLYEKDILVRDIISKYKLDEGTFNDHFVSASSLARKAMNYFCVKFVSKYHSKFNTNPGTINSFNKLAEKIRLRNLSDETLFLLIDHSFDKRKNSKSPVLPKYILEDFDVYLTFARPKEDTPGDAFDVDSDGRIRIKR